jgi:hypothetical protein
MTHENITTGSRERLPDARPAGTREGGLGMPSTTTSSEGLILRRIVRGLVLLWLAGAVLLPTSARAQVYPNRLEIGKFTCRQLLSYTGDERARVLIYFNGYVDGRHNSKVWEEKAVGARVDRALAMCTATPSLPALEAFMKAWKP